MPQRRVSGDEIAPRQQPINLRAGSIASFVMMPRRRGFAVSARPNSIGSPDSPPALSAVSPSSPNPPTAAIGGRVTTARSCGATALSPRSAPSPSYLHGIRCLGDRHRVAGGAAGVRQRSPSYRPDPGAARFTRHANKGAPALSTPSWWRTKWSTETDGSPESTATQHCASCINHCKAPLPRTRSSADGCRRRYCRMSAGCMTDISIPRPTCPTTVRVRGSSDAAARP
jgi:hypothetical protein